MRNILRAYRSGLVIAGPSEFVLLYIFSLFLLFTSLCCAATRHSLLIGRKSLIYFMRARALGGGRV